MKLFLLQHECFHTSMQINNSRHNFQLYFLSFFFSIYFILTVMISFHFPYFLLNPSSSPFTILHRVSKKKSNRKIKASLLGLKKQPQQISYYSIKTKKCNNKEDQLQIQNKLLHIKQCYQ